MSNESEADEAEQDAADEAETEEQTEAEAEVEGLQNGDFIELDYTARTVEGGDLVDTTDPEVAEEEGVGEDQEFGPRTIVLGEGHVFDAVEGDIVGSEVGDTGTVTVPAVDAFGEFDDEEVRTISADRIPEDDRYPGAHVDIDGEHGHINTIIGGRARVDFNHPLAGEDIEYEYEILELIDDREQQAAGMLGMYLQEAPEVRIESVTEEEETVTEDDDGEETVETEEVEKDVLYVTATQAMQMNQQWMFQKQQIAQDLMGRLDLDRVVVEEVIEGGGMGGLGGMMGGMGGAGAEDIEDALEDVDVDADEIVDEIDEE